jgi:hypothetical protein
MELGKLFHNPRKRKTLSYNEFVIIEKNTQQLTKSLKLCKFLKKRIWFD